MSGRVRVYWVVVRLFDISSGRCSHILLLLHLEFPPFSSFRHSLGLEIQQGSTPPVHSIFCTELVTPVLLLCCWKWSPEGGSWLHEVDCLEEYTCRCHHTSTWIRGGPKIVKFVTMLSLSHSLLTITVCLLQEVFSSFILARF